MLMLNLRSLPIIFNYSPQQVYFCNLLQSFDVLSVNEESVNNKSNLYNLTEVGV